FLHCSQKEAEAPGRSQEKACRFLPVPGSRKPARTCEGLPYSRRSFPLPEGSLYPPLQGYPDHGKEPLPPRGGSTLFPHFLYCLHHNQKSTRLNSSHVSISYAVFCLKKKNN